MSVCLGWTGLARAADLVQFLPSFDIYSLKPYARVMANSPSDLGFSSISIPDDRSGEFYVTMFDPLVQVVFFSDDGVDVQVTDVGDLSDPLGPVTENMNGLTNLGKGQALPDVEQSLKVIPATFTPNHTYRFQWQFRNTFYTGDGDIDGMKVFVIRGEAQLALAPPAKKTATFSHGIPPNETIWSAFISPDPNGLVLPGSVFTLQVEYYEVDSLTLVDSFGTRVLKVPFELNEDDETGVEITLDLKNATFDDGASSATLQLEKAIDYLVLNPRPKIQVNPNLAADAFVEVTLSSVTDPGRISNALLDSLKNDKYDITPSV